MFEDALDHALGVGRMLTRTFVVDADLVEARRTERLRPLSDVLKKLAVMKDEADLIGSFRGAHHTRQARAVFDIARERFFIEHGNTPAEQIDRNVDTVLGMQGEDAALNRVIRYE